MSTTEVASKLFKAVEQNDCSELMNLILSHHCDPRDVCNEQKQTLLHVACQLGHLNIIRILVEVYQCSISKSDNDNYSPSDYACLSGHLHLILYFKVCDIKHICCSGKLPLIRLACAASQFGSAVLCLKPILFNDAYYIICKHLGVVPFERCFTDVPVHVFSSASHTGNLEMARLALDELANGMFVDSVNPKLSSLLSQEACRLGHNDLISYLIISRGQSILGSPGAFTLDNPYFCLQTSKIEFIARTSVEPKLAENHFVSNLCSDTMLHSIVHCGNFVAIKKLLLAQHYSDQSLVNKNGNTVLHSACVSRRLDIVQVLVEDMNCDINHKNEMGNAPLHMAIEWGAIEIAKYLLKKGCIVNQANELGQTPLYLSVSHERKTIFHLLVNMDVDINAVTTDNEETPLHKACCCDSAELAMLLLECDQQNCHNSVDAYGDTPLFNACRVENADLELIELMISKGCKARFVNTVTKETPVHIACRRGRIDIMKVLLKYGDQGPINQCNFVEMSLLHLACYNDDAEMVEFLLSNHICEVNSLDIFGFAPLHIAAIRNATSIAKLLLKSPCYSNINVEDRDGNVPLHHICKREVVDIELVQMLTNDAAIVHQNQKGFNPVHFIFENSYGILLIQCILSHHRLTIKDKKRAIFAVDLDENTPLHLACKNGRSAPVNVMLGFLSFAVELITSALLGMNLYGDTPLHLACAKNHIDIIESILGNSILSEECILKAMTQQNKAGLTVLHVSCNKVNADVLKCVLTHLKDDIIKSSMGNLTQHNGMSPLHLACQRNSVAIVTCVLDLNFRKDLIQSIFHVLTAKCDSLLHIASQRSDSVDICKLLIEQQLCNVMHQNNAGDTALHIACRNNHTELALLLCESKSEPHCHNNDDESPVFLAAQCLTKEYSSSTLKEMLQKRYCNWIKSVEQRECHKPKNRFGYVYINDTSYCYTEASCRVQLPLLHSIVRMCCINNYHTQKFMQLVVEALTSGQVSPNIHDSFGNTVLHIYASMDRYFDHHYKYVYSYSQADDNLLSYILHLSECDVNMQNHDGNTPLHIACLLNKEGITRLLMQCEKANKSIGIKNKNGYLPIHCASSVGVLNCLIAHGASIDDITDSRLSKQIKERYSRLKSGYPLNPPITILVIGNSSAGKTTLIKSLKSDLEMTLTDIVDVGHNPTAGIVRYEIESKEFGKVIFYDFAGQPEYESSHSALLQSILSSSTNTENLPVLFFLVIDVTATNVIKHLHYWLSFIQNCPLPTTAHVVVVGSHVDRVSISDAPSKADIIKAEIEAHVKQSSMMIHLIGTPILVNCRKLGEAESQQLKSLFTESKTELKKCAEIDHRCYALYAFLLQNFQQNPVKLADLVSDLKNQRIYDGVELPTAEGILLKLLETMHARQYLLLFKEGAQDSSEYWILTTTAQNILYTQVNGVLFAPESIRIEKRITIKSNVGVIPSSTLKENFRDVDFEVLQQFLVYNEFCQKIEDHTTLQLIEGNSRSKLATVESTTEELSGETQNTISSVSYFFFPGLVKTEKPEDVAMANMYHGYTSGWCLECPEGCYFTIQFLQVLLLRCTFCFATKHQQGNFLDRKCIIWKNGIFWGTPDGVEALVELIEQNTVVIVLIRCLNGHEMSAVKLRADVISKVLAVQAKHCPDLRVSEYIINPSSVAKFEESQSVNVLHKICIAEVAVSISNGFACVLDTKSRPLHINKNLLHFEPYAGIGKNPELLASLFDPDKANQDIPEKVLSEYANLAHEAGATPHQIGHMMSIPSREIQQSQVSEPGNLSMLIFRLFLYGVSSYRGLQELFDLYSIFRGRNPLVSHLIKVLI